MQPNQPQQPIQPIYAPAPVSSPGGGWSRKQKIIMLSTGIFVGLALLLMIFVSIFGSSQSANQVLLTTVNARNSELLNLFDDFESELRTAEGKEYVSRAKILITSDNLALTNYLAARYSSAPSEQQILDLDFTSISSELEKATAQSDFDKFFISTVNFEIESNKTLLDKFDPDDGDSVINPLASTMITNYDSLLN